MTEALARDVRNAGTVARRGRSEGETRWPARRPRTERIRREAITRVIDALRADVAESWTLRDMADVALYSPYHFNRVFAATVGVPPRRFLAALRIEEAKRLLLRTEYSVTRICHEVGYESLGTFVTRFTEFVGLSPRALRRRYGNGDSSATSVWRDSPPPSVRGTGTVRGTVVGDHEGMVFIGLFPALIAYGHPMGCAVREGPGPYRIDGVDEGQYYVLAFGLPGDERPADAGVDGFAPPMFGRSDEQITVDRDAEIGGVELRLRPRTPMDPPVLVDLDSVFGQREAGEGWATQKSSSR